MNVGTRTFIAYDTLCRIRIEADQDRVEELLDKAQSIAFEVQATLNMYDPNSELSILCSEYKPGESQKISAMLAEFLDMNLFFCEATNGAFDPTVGSLTKLWDFLADTPRVPSPEQITLARKRVGYGHIHLNCEARSVCLDVPGIIIDPGASGKGFALKLVVDMLQREGITHGVVDFGGNMYLLGGKKDGTAERPWRIALIDADDTKSYIGAVSMRDQGIATSSWYEHSFKKDGRIYHHLLDPYTGNPKPLSLKSVSIISSDAAYTDFLSTAFFILGLEKGKALVERLTANGKVFIAYVTMDDKRIIKYSDNIAFSPKSD